MQVNYMHSAHWRNDPRNDCERGDSTKTRHFLDKFIKHQMLKQNPTRGVTVVFYGSFWSAWEGGKI